MSSEKLRKFITGNFILLCFIGNIFQTHLCGQNRGRIRDFGIETGVLRTGRMNAITDVTGVLVGHQTIIKGDSVRTGVTAIIPHGGNIFQNKVPGAVYVANGFGKLAGSTQVEELGEIETPIVLTNTLSVSDGVKGVINYVLKMKGNEEVRSVNALVGETNDGWLNDIRGMHVTQKDVWIAIETADSGIVKEGSVGAGTGTRCLGFKGGIGTASRKLPDDLGGWTIGVLVQSNFGGILRINGAPIGRELDTYYLKNRLQEKESGSCMIIVATDAPLLNRNLKRLASRAILGLARCGGFCSNGSGDYVIAFSAYPGCRISDAPGTPYLSVKEIQNDRMSPLFLAVVEATEEAILNSLFQATTVTGIQGHVSEELPILRVLEIAKKYRIMNWSDHFSPMRSDKN